MSQFQLIRAACCLAAAVLPIAAPAAAAPTQRSRHIIPMPLIPEALRGCWVPDDPDFPEDTDRLVVTETGFTLGSRTVRPDYVDAVGPRSVTGLFTAIENGRPMTIATTLQLGDGERVPADQLILSEGDAGAFRYSRCPA